MPSASQRYLSHETATLDPKNYLSLVKSIAYQLHCKLPPHIDIDDLIQTGYLGLTQAIQRFSSAGGAQFETFASLRIRGAMLDYLRQEDSLPSSLRQLTKKIEHLEVRLSNDGSSLPNDQTLATMLQVSIEEIQSARLLSSQFQFLSLDDLPQELHDTLIDPNSDPFSSLHFKQILSELSEFISSFNENERLVLSLHYEEDLSFKDISTVLELSEPRISQIHSHCLSKIKKLLKNT